MKKKYIFALVACGIFFVLIFIILFLNNKITDITEKLKETISNYDKPAEDEKKSSENDISDTDGNALSPAEQASASQNPIQNIKHTLSVSKTGSGGGSININPSGISCDELEDENSCTEEYVEGTSIRLTPNTGADSLFTGWSGDCSGVGSCTVIMNQDREVTANFEFVEEFSVSISKTGSGVGTVTSSISGINCGSICSYIFQSVSPIQLTAVPDSGSQFISWAGCDSVDSNVCHLTPDGNKVVTAKFFLGYKLTVAKI
ncbi:MAG: hypothetical protein AABY16_00030, partial [Nanoarchaeota archaeon]